jgi:hypothetical protein
MPQNNNFYVYCHRTKIVGDTLGILYSDISKQIKSLNKKGGYFA